MGNFVKINNNIRHHTSDFRHLLIAQVVAKVMQFDTASQNKIVIR